MWLFYLTYFYLVICRGYRIPKGATIFCSMHSMHRNEVFYSDPDKFIPERFLSDKSPMYISANSPPEARDHFNFGWGR